MLNVVIGFDREEAIAYHVLSHSIMRRASKPVRILPLYLPQLQASGAYTRERDAGQSTDFTYSRFLAPYLCNFEGPVIFLDCDILCLADIHKLHEYLDVYQDVAVVKHDYTPRTARKMSGVAQTTYPCKNWSSVMVFNHHRVSVRKLIPEYVNRATAMELHQFKWAQSVGELPPEWNHLVGEAEPNPNAALVHFTLGGPWLAQYKDCEYSTEWRIEAAHAFSTTGERSYIMLDSNASVPT